MGLSTRQFLRMYEKACRQLNLRPLATYNGNGIYDFKRTKKSLIKIKNLRNVL